MELYNLVLAVYQVMFFALVLALPATVIIFILTRLARSIRRSMHQIKS